MLARLKAHGLQVELYATTGPGDATAMLQARRELPPLVIAAGGDGTVNEVLNGLGDRDIALGLIPTGTTNVLATELGYPAAPAAVARVLAAGHEQQVHFARVNGRRFAMMVGVGYDAWVVAGVRPAVKKRLGKLAYVLAMFASLRKVGSRHYRAVCDGVAHDVISAVLTNGRHYAGSYIITRQADIAMPTLEAVLIKPVSRLRFFGMLLLLPLGLAEKLSFVQVVRARDIRIDSDDPEDPVQADGDTIGRMPVQVQSEAQTSRVIVP